MCISVGNLSSEDEHRCWTSGCAPSGKYLKVLRKIKESEILNRKGKYKKGQQTVSKESCLQCENENTTKKIHTEKWKFIKLILLKGC